jgi:hypothetical protein
MPGATFKPMHKAVEETERRKEEPSGEWFTGWGCFATGLVVATVG